MSAGRKRTFDTEEALDKAMRVFWENGYSGTSLTDLTAALGINKPSLYSAFGNKEQLFSSSIEHYNSTYSMPTFAGYDSSTEKTFKGRLQSFLYALIDTQTNSETPCGCFFVKCLCESGSTAFPSDVAAAIQEMDSSTEKVLAEILESEVELGTLSSTVSVQELSIYLQSVMFGLAVQARSGKSKKELRAIADIAVQTFPSSD